MKNQADRQRDQRESVKRFAYPAVVAVVLVAAWQALVTGFDLPPYLVPSPILMMKTLFTDWAALGHALFVTVKITVLAFVMATVAGVLISFLFVQSRSIETALFPYAVLLQVTPIVAVAPLIIIWIKDPTVSMVICAALVALFPVIANTTLGLRSVDPDLQSYFRLNRATRTQTLLRLRIPSALPYFFGGLRISSGLALTSPSSSPAPAALARALRTRSCNRASSSTSRACLPRCCSFRSRAWCFSSPWPG